MPRPRPSTAPTPPRRPPELGGTQTQISGPSSSPTPTPRPGNNEALTNNGGGQGGGDASSRLGNCTVAGAAINASCSASSSNTNAGNFTTGASQNGQQMNAQQQAEVSDMCRQSGQNASAAVSVISGVMDQCQAAISNCSSFCAAVPEAQLNSSQRSQLTTARNQCYNGSNMMATLQSQLSQAQSAQDRANQCLSDMSQAPVGASAANSSLGMAQACLTNPNSPQCYKLKEDCANPQVAASSEVCRCLNNRGCKTSRDSARSMSDDGAASQASGESPAPTGGYLGTDGSKDSSKAAAYESSRGDMNLNASAQGGSGRSNSGANKPGLKMNRAPSRINPDVLVGLSSGASIRFGGSGAAGPDSGVYGQNGSWIPPRVGTAPEASMPSMERFRPKMDRDGFRAPAANSRWPDIHGANVNMWKQMNLRYQALQGTLIP